MLPFVSSRPDAFTSQKRWTPQAKPAIFCDTFSDPAGAMFFDDMEFSVGSVGFDDTAPDGTRLDLLNRKPFGQRLSTLVDCLAAPSVIALDGAWGTGKSHFLKLWCGAHLRENDGKALPVYFDAFAEDYLDDPLLSLVAAIDRAPAADEKPSTAAATMKLLKRSAAPLTRSALRIGLAAATAGLSEIKGPILDAAANATEDEGKQLVDGLWARERGRTKALEDFRKALTKLAAERPLILVVDELDRCRPDYALSLLEIAKHTFHVPGVHFILGVNLTALEQSVRKRYGAGIDAWLYLQKFYHLRLELPDREDARQVHWQKMLDTARDRLPLDGEHIHFVRELLFCLSSTRQISLRDT